MSSAVSGLAGRFDSSTKFITTANHPESERFDYWREAICDFFLHLDFLPASNRAFFGEIAINQVNEIGFAHALCRETNYRRTPLWVHRDKEETLFIFFQASGTSLIMQDGREAEIEPGDFVCLDSTRPYTMSSSDYNEAFMLKIPRRIWVNRLGPTERVTARTMRGNTYIGAMVTSHLRQVIAGIGTVDPATAERLAEISLSLVATAFGDLISQKDLCRDSRRTALLYRAKNLIEENLRDLGLNPTMLARTLGISERYLHDLFQEESTTVTNWIWQRRLEQCRKDLSNQFLANNSVGQIAFNWGFNNLSHFHRRFKAAFSTTPAEFRYERLLTKVRPHQTQY